jgi:CheY-like chemotaxis protein
MTNHHASVLVVDDDFDICEVYGEALADCGYAVTTARNGREALRYLDGSSLVPDVIIVDLMMPIMDGRELIAEIKQRPRFNHTPIVMMTANRGLPLVEGTTQLYKPFSLEVLCGVVESVVDWDDEPERAMSLTS